MITKAGIREMRRVHNIGSWKEWKKLCDGYSIDSSEVAYFEDADGFRFKYVGRYPDSKQKVSE